MEAGLYDDISFEDYLAIDALSTSQLKTLLPPDGSPKKYRWLQMNPEESKPSPAMVLGTLAHTIILEPDRFDKEVLVAPVDDRRKKAFKDVEAEAKESDVVTDVITRSEYDRLMYMAESVRDNKFASELLTGGKPEVTMLWRENMYSVNMKGRADYINGDNIIDLKTTLSAEPSSFNRDAIHKYRYNMQAYLYTRGYTTLTDTMPAFYFICVEKSPPYDCVVRVVDEYFLTEGAGYAEKALELIYQCHKSGLYPGNGDAGVVPLSASEFWHAKYLEQKGERENA